MEKVKKPFYKKWWVWLIAVVVIAAFISNQLEDEEVAAEEPEQAEESNEPAEEDSDIEESNEPDIEDETEEPAEKEEEPKTLEDEVENILSDVMGDDGIVNLDVLDVGGETIVETTLMASENFSINQIKTRMTSDATDIIEQLFDIEDIDETVLHFDLPLTDDGGNEEVTTVLTVMMDREHENSIDWDNFVYTNLPDEAKGFAEHPAIRD